MALITISGYPSSGKSTRASQIQAYFEKRIEAEDLNYKVTLLSDHSLGIARSAYSDSRSEKTSRAILFAALQRHLSTGTFLIIDSPNYIKGFRYQMYCAAREMKVRTCTVYVVATQDLCRQWNSSRSPEDSYSAETLENLFLRYEEPSSMVRWDSPLITTTWADASVSLEDVWSAITGGTIKAPNSGTINNAQTPTQALLILESAVNAIVHAIQSAQSMSSSGLVKLDVPQNLSIQLPERNLSLSELQRLKRQFITMHKKVVSLGTTEKGSVQWDESSIMSKFVVFLEEHLKD